MKMEDVFEHIGEQRFEQLVAYVLDQLPAGEVQETEALLAQDAVAREMVKKLRALVDEIRQDLAALAAAGEI